MRRCLPIAVILGLFISDAVSQEQGQDAAVQGQGAAQRLPAATSASAYIGQQDSGYFASAGVVRFQLTQGRLRLDAPRHRKGSQTSDEQGIHESITVTACRGIPSLHYVCQTPSHHITLSVQRAVHVRLESRFPKTGERAILDQPEHGAITWTTQRGQLGSVITGATLLHVRHQDIAGFDLHCEPVIRQLLNGRTIRQLSEDTEAVLLERLTTDASDTINASAVLECVKRLSAAKQSTRRAAHRQLFNWGTPIIPIVNAMPASQLSTEQADCLREILSRFHRQEDDTAASLAAMLQNDRDYWQSLAEQLSGQQLEVANTHLSRVGLTPIQFVSGPVARIAERR